MLRCRIILAFSELSKLISQHGFLLIP